MVDGDQVALARQLIASFGYRGEPVSDVAIPLAAIIALVRTTLESSAFFSPNLAPAGLGDGALIERLSAHRYRVHERHERWA